MGCTSLKTLSLAAAVGFMLTTSGAQAQKSSAAPVCDALEAPLEEGGEAYLQIVCGEAGVILGRVDEYQLIQIPSLKSAVALTTLEGTRRAWLIMNNGERDVALEEITGTIARLAGRGTRRNIDGLELDFSKLNTGRLTAAIRSPKGDAAAQDGTNAAGEAELDLAEMVNRSRVIRNSNAAGGAN